MSVGDIQKQVEKAENFVKDWPEWKRRINPINLYPMGSTPREPVDNSNKTKLINLDQSKRTT